MELTGKVILDEESMDELKDQLRKDILKEIKEKGLNSFEIAQILNDYNYESYIHMIHCTIGNVVSKTNKEDINFNSDRKAYQKLLAIKSIVDI